MRGRTTLLFGLFNKTVSCFEAYRPHYLHSALPVIPETKKTDGQTGARKEEESLIEVKPPIKHVLSRELQVCRKPAASMLYKLSGVTFKALVDLQLNVNF